MSRLGQPRCALLFLVTFLPTTMPAVSLPSCADRIRAWQPCELSFEWNSSDLPEGAAPDRDELLNVEFRSPRHTTFLMHDFWDGGKTLKVRFTPGEAGAWAYHVTSRLKAFDDKEGNFSVTESNDPGFVSVANVRHWRSTNKQPHLWLGASLPLAEVQQTALDPWLDARKHDGFTHIRGTVLSAGAASKPIAADQQINVAYFQDLDGKLLAADTRGFTLDLILADQSFIKQFSIDTWDRWDPVLRYVVARYGGLNVTWQGIEHFEDTPGARAWLRQVGSFLQSYDAFKHPRSTDAQVSSSPLVRDGWMNFLIEASPDPEFGAVEHQFTEEPEIHVITATEPESFRHELWSATTNGEYPSVSFEALRNEANIKAVQIWARIMVDTRHWELEPYFDVDGARAVGLAEVEYLSYAEKPGIVEITLPKHKYNPVWVNPISGEEIPMKDYKGEVFSRQTPDNAHDWILQVPREGHKESMLRSYRFESADVPLQEAETDPARMPFEVVEPKGEELKGLIPVPYSLKLTRSNRASRTMQYVWWGEVVANGEGPRVLGLGPKGNLTVDKLLVKQPDASLHLKVLAINANGKAYELDRVYRLTP